MQPRSRTYPHQAKPSIHPSVSLSVCLLAAMRLLCPWQYPPPCPRVSRAATLTHIPTSSQTIHPSISQFVCLSACGYAAALSLAIPTSLPSSQSCSYAHAHTHIKPNHPCIHPSVSLPSLSAPVLGARLRRVAALCEDTGLPRAM